MNPQDDPRYHRLPVWVRTGIDQLVRERDQARAAHREALLDSDPESTNTRLVTSVGRPEVGLPNYANVRHYLTNSRADDGTFIDTRIERYGSGTQNGRLLVMASAGVVVHHRAGNTFYVDVVGR